MITIEHAILHIIDTNNAATILSDTEMDLTVVDAAEDFLNKHIERSIGSQEAKAGTFYEDSDFQGWLLQYLQQELTFIEFSQMVAKALGKILMHADDAAAADLVICDIHIDEQRTLVIFKCNNRQGFIHQVTQTDHGIKNDIVHQLAIMPGLTQKIDEFVFIDMQTRALTVCAKRYTIDGNSILVFPEALLECNLSPSPKEAIQTINKTAKKVAENFGRDPLETATAVKTVIAKELEISDALDPIRAGQKIFADNPAMQQDYDEQVKNAGFAENQPIHVDKEATLKKILNHKLKTDTGIELTIPVDYFDNTEYVEFSNNPDGSLSITLKHINNIMNRT